MNYSWFYTEIPFMSFGKVPFHIRTLIDTKEAELRPCDWAALRGIISVELKVVQARSSVCRKDERWSDGGGEEKEDMATASTAGYQTFGYYQSTLLHPFMVRLQPSSVTVNVTSLRSLAGVEQIEPAASTRLNTSSCANKSDEKIPKNFSSSFFFFASQNSQWRELFLKRSHQPKSFWPKLFNGIQVER